MKLISKEIEMTAKILTQYFARWLTGPVHPKTHGDLSTFQVDQRRQFLELALKQQPFHPFEKMVSQ
jgi:hypothetical protein